MIDRAERFLVARVFTAEVIGLTLVVVALKTLASGVSFSLTETNTQDLFRVALIAALISFGLSKSRFKAYQASAWIAALGVIGIWILGARLTGPLLDLVKSTLTVIQDYVLQIIPAIKSHSAIEVDTLTMSEAWSVIASSSSALAARWQIWLINLNRSGGINDALVRTMLWALIMWLCSAWTGWFAARRNAVTSLLPAVALLAIVVSYSEHKVESLWLMVVTLLLLMGVWNYEKHIRVWQGKKIDYSDSIRTDVTQAVLMLAVGIGIIAFITPSISWSAIRDFFRNGNKNEVAEILGVQEHTVPGKPVNVQLPSLPSDHLLDAGYARSQKIVMTIHTGELPPISSPSIAATAPRYYWRNAVYDVYVGSGWVTSKLIPQKYSANTPLIPGLLNGYRLVHLDVNMVQPEGKLFWSGVLFSTDIPMTPRWRVRPKLDLFADQTALLQADIFAVPTAATDYLADVYISTATIKDLRTASTEYPDNVTAHYLSLPDSVPDRVIALAKVITEGKTNPYDKAKAIESYLRTNYPYDLDIPAPPIGKDVADYFLFDLKKGYCDYYATAMVVLARASGLPARFVSGYAPGSYDAPTAQYIVREMNAHSWVEVYFPEIGWIEFEPTASQPGIEPRIERTDEFVSIPSDQGNQEAISDLLTRFRLERILLWSSPVIGILLLTLIYFSFLERWTYLRHAPPVAIERIHQAFYHAARPMAGAWTPAETSSEFLARLTRRMDAINNRSRFTKLFSNIKRNAASLTSLYNATLFTTHQTHKRDAVTAWKTWKRLQRELFFAKLLAFTEKSKSESNTG